MSEQSFTTDQMQLAHMAGQLEIGTDPSNIAARSYVKGLTKPEWKPADGQGYINDEGGMYRVNGCHNVIGLNVRPFTVKEAGKEPMQHLVGGLTFIANHQLPTNAATLMALAQTVLDKHKELIK